MKIVRSENNTFINDDLLGGAALSLSDLVRIESQEIEWVFSAQVDNKFEDGQIAA